MPETVNFPFQFDMMEITVFLTNAIHRKFSKNKIQIIIISGTFMRKLKI